MFHRYMNIVFAVSLPDMDRHEGIVDLTFAPSYFNNSEVDALLSDLQGTHSDVFWYHHAVEDALYTDKFQMVELSGHPKTASTEAELNKVTLIIDEKEALEAEGHDVSLNHLRPHQNPWHIPEADEDQLIIVDVLNQGTCIAKSVQRFVRVGSDLVVVSSSITGESVHADMDPLIDEHIARFMSNLNVTLLRNAAFE